MKNRRDEMLYEMGITTVWHLRESAGQPADTFSTAVAEVVSAEVSVGENSATGATKAPNRSVVASGMDWNALKAAVAGCRACALHQRRNNTVFGVGDEQADWLFVGEGPGAEARVPVSSVAGMARSYSKISSKKSSIACQERRAARAL